MSRNGYLSERTSMLAHIAQTRGATTQGCRTGRALGTENGRSRPMALGQEGRSSASFGSRLLLKQSGPQMPTGIQRCAGCCGAPCNGQSSRALASITVPHSEASFLRNKAGRELALQAARSKRPVLLGLRRAAATRPRRQAWFTEPWPSWATLRWRRSPTLTCGGCSKSMCVRMIWSPHHPRSTLPPVRWAERTHTHTQRLHRRQHGTCVGMGYAVHRLCRHGSPDGAPVAACWTGGSTMFPWIWFGTSTIRQSRTPAEIPRPRPSPRYWHYGCLA